MNHTHKLTKKSGEDEHERDGEKKKNNGIAYLVKTEIIPYLSHSKLSYCEITIIPPTDISIDRIIPFSNKAWIGFILLLLKFNNFFMKNYSK